MDTLDDTIENGLDAVESVSSLLKEALSASTTHEKDKLILNLMKSWEIENEAANIINNVNSQRQEVLSRLQEKNSSIQEDFEAFYTNTSFLNELDRYDSSSKADLIETIKKVEKSIAKIKPLASPNALNETIELSPKEDIHNLKTRDLLFTRLEELSYALKKRILVVEDSTNASINAIEKFGSVSGLINAHNELLEENEILKKEESKYMNDAMAKRRNLTTISPSLLTNISVAMQSQLEALRTYGHNLSVPMELDDVSQHFDKVCSIPKSISFTRADFGTTIDPELVSAIEKAETSEEKLNLLRSIMMEQYQSIQKLVNELQPFRATTYCSNPDSKERLERLWGLNDKFSAQIIELTTNIEKRNDEIRDLNLSILRSIKQRKYIEEQYCSIIKMILPLIEETKDLSYVTMKNKTIMKNVSKICYNFALALYDEETENFRLTKDLLQSRLPHPPPEIKVVEPPQPQIEEPEEDKATHAEDPRKFFMIKQPTIKKTARPRRQLVPAESQKPSVSEPPNPIRNASSVQLLDFIALAHDITMSVEKTEPLFHPTISGTLHKCLSVLSDDIKAKSNECKSNIHEMIERLQLGEKILRVPKVDIETTIETCPTTETAMMTEAPEPPSRKGKGKKPSGKKSAR